MYFGSIASLMAATSIPLSKAALNTSLPILPNPVIPIFKLMKNPPYKSILFLQEQLYPLTVKKSKSLYKFYKKMKKAVNKGC